MTQPLKNGLDAPEVMVENAFILHMVGYYSCYSLQMASMLFETPSEVSCPNLLNNYFFGYLGIKGSQMGIEPNNLHELASRAAFKYLLRQP